MKHAIAICFLFIFQMILCDPSVHALGNAEVRSVHTGQQEFTSITKAVEAFESKYQKIVMLPSKYPFEFTSEKGMIHHEDKILELEFINEETKDILKIFVSPNPKMWNPQPKDKRLVLNDGTIAYARVKFLGFYQLEFKKDGLVYEIWIGTNTKKSITPETLKEIADSMEKNTD